MERYLTQGWHRFCFLITPDELRSVTLPFHFVIGNAHVPMDYTESPAEEFITAYAALYDKLISCEPIEWLHDHRLFLIRHITSDLSRCGYGQEHEYNGSLYRRCCFEQPAACLSPFTLTFSRNTQQQFTASTRGSFIQHAQNYFGLELSYPKRIQFSSGTEYEPMHGTGPLAGFGDFLSLREAITKITSPLRVGSAGNEKRLAVRVSGGVKHHLDNCRIFLSNDVRVK